MDKGVVGAIAWLVATLLVVGLFVRARRRRGRIGAAASGAMYDLLNEDRRKAVEIIIEERTGERDPEDKDGNLPDLAGGARSTERDERGRQV